jgi:hypothetical protein
VQDQRQRREQLVKLRQVLLDDRVIFGRQLDSMQFARPLDEDRLRRVIGEGLPLFGPSA